MTPTRQRSIIVQELRGIAVIAVILFHAWPGIFKSGYLGVDLFFIISGFLIVPMILNLKLNFKGKRQSIKSLLRLKSFYQRRFYRLFPALIFVITFNLFLLTLFAGIGYLRNSYYLAIYSLFGFGNFGAYFFQGNYFSPNSNPFLHLWSLGVEEQVYIIAPVILAFLFTSIKNFKPKLFIVFFGLISLASYIFISYSTFAIPLISDRTSFNFYSTSSRIWEFCLGGFISLHSLEQVEKKNIFEKNKFRFLVGPVLVTLILFSKVNNLFLSIFIFIFHKIILTGQNSLIGRKDKELLTWFGDRSYSIYLVHLPLIWIVKHSPIFKRLSEEAGSYNSLLAISVLIGVLIGHLLYESIEVKFRRIPIYSGNYKKKQIKNLGEIFLFSIIFISFFTYAEINKFWVSNSSLSRPISEMDPSASSCYPMGINSTCHVSGGKQVLLLGDSHGGSISKSLSMYVQSAGLGVDETFEAGCILISPSSYDQARSLGPDFNKCLNYSKRVERILHENSFSQVIITYRSHSLASKISEGNWFASPKKFRNLVSTELVHIKKVCNCKVIFLGPTPEFPDKDYFFSMNRLIIQGEYRAPKKFLIRKMMTEPFQDDISYPNLLNKTGVVYISVLPVLCSVDDCIRFKNGWLYSDYDHLSHLGAKFFVNKINLSKLS